MISLKKDAYNAKKKNIEEANPDITNLTTKSSLHAKINKLKVKYLILLT